MPNRALSAPRWRIVKHGLFCGALGLLIGLTVQAGRYLLGPNVHTVIPDRIYRCAQLSPSTLDRVIRQHRIRTIVNFRGCCAPEQWYLDEGRVANRHNVSLENVGCYAGRLPPIYVIHELVQIFDRAEYPILIHCRRGIDRTGLGAAMAKILLEDAPLEEALEELSLNFLHLNAGKTASMDRFFELYRQWLQREGKWHSRDAFREWAMNVYSAGPCLAKIEILDHPNPYVKVPRGKPISLRVRCWNKSTEVWTFHPAKNAGIHLRYHLTSPAHVHVQESEVGLFHAKVPPGDKIDLTLALRPICEPGTYKLRVDLKNGQNAYFFQQGSEPLYIELEVP